MQVKVRALIRHGDKIVVARESVRGLARLSLPGGRPRAGEELLEALAREVREETGLEIHAGRLLYVAESVNGHSVQDLNLVFAAAPVGPLDESAPYLVDLRSPEAADVMPPILDTIADVLPRGTLTVPGRFPVDSVVTFQVPVRNDGTRPLRIDHLAPG